MNYGECNNGYSKFSRHIIHPFMPDGVFDDVTVIFITRMHYILSRGQFAMPNVMVTSTSGATTWPVDYYAMHMVSGAVIGMQLTCSGVFL
jgi:hypothetical protein